MLTKTDQYPEYNFKVIKNKDGNKRVVKEIIMPKVVKEYKYTIVKETTTRKETETVKRITHDGTNKNSSYTEETLPTKVITTVRSYIQDSGGKDKPPKEFIKELPGKVSTVSYIDNSSKKVVSQTPVSYNKTTSVLPSKENATVHTISYKHQSLDKVQVKPSVNYTVKTKSYLKEKQQQLSKSFSKDINKDKDIKKNLSKDYRRTEVKSYAKSNVNTNVKSYANTNVKSSELLEQPIYIRHSIMICLIIAELVALQM